MDLLWWAAVAALAIAASIILIVNHHAAFAGMLRRAYPAPQLSEAALWLFLGASSWDAGQRLGAAVFAVLAIGTLASIYRRRGTARLGSGG